MNDDGRAGLAGIGAVFACLALLVFVATVIGGVR